MPPPPTVNRFDDVKIRPKSRHIVFTSCRGTRRDQGIGYTDFRDVIEENMRAVWSAQHPGIKFIDMSFDKKVRVG